MSRHKHLDQQALEDLEEAQELFEPYLSYIRLTEFQGAKPLEYGPWKSMHEEVILRKLEQNP